MKTIICEKLGIRYPIIQGGMVWASSWHLASAVSNAGGLGLLGAGSMSNDQLKENIKVMLKKTNKPFGVNVPIDRANFKSQVELALEMGVKIFFTSAGNPAIVIPFIKEKGAVSAHVVPSVKHAKKAESVGADIIVAEGTEAGGHNGFDEITTMCLVPQAADAVKVPVIAAGGIADGRGIAAALSLGAVGVQIGTRFLATKECLIHDEYKKMILEAADTSTVLTAKKIGPVRLIKNDYALQLINAEAEGKSAEEIRTLYGKKASMLAAIFGDRIKGGFQSGQGAGLINDIPSVSELIEKMVSEAKNRSLQVYSICSS